MFERLQNNVTWFFNFSHVRPDGDVIQSNNHLKNQKAKRKSQKKNKHSWESCLVKNIIPAKFMHYKRQTTLPLVLKIMLLSFSINKKFIFPSSYNLPLLRFLFLFSVWYPSPCSPFLGSPFPFFKKGEEIKK